MSYNSSDASLSDSETIDHILQPFQNKLWYLIQYFTRFFTFKGWSDTCFFAQFVIYVLSQSTPLFKSVYISSLPFGFLQYPRKVSWSPWWRTLSVPSDILSKTLDSLHKDTEAGCKHNEIVALHLRQIETRKIVHVDN